MQAVREKLTDMKEMRKAKAEAKAEEKVYIYNNTIHENYVVENIG